MHMHVHEHISYVSSTVWEMSKLIMSMLLIIYTKFIENENALRRVFIHSKNFDIVNKKVRDEKEKLLGHYICLKRLLDGTHHHEHDHLKVLHYQALERCPHAISR